MKKIYSLQKEIVVKNRGRNKTVIKKMIMSKIKKQSNQKLIIFKLKIKKLK